MHFRVPKPLHGWREFAGEVGIIVIGVLIALGAEQVVETIHWRHEVGLFRNSVDHEMANNLGTYTYRMKENACVDARLRDLDRLLASWRAGHPLALTGPIGAPSSLSLETSVWQSRDANIVTHMPMRERMAIGRMYDEFANNEEHRLDEREAWLELGEFNGASDLDHADLMRLQGLINRARYRQAHITLNAMTYLKRASGIGVKPIWNDFPPADLGICKPIPSTKPGTGG
jgi:hypothetical protein